MELEKKPKRKTMAKKETVKRKTGKDLRKEYRGLLDKTKALQTRIYNRAQELTKQYPDVVFMNAGFPDEKPITVSDYVGKYKLTPQTALSIIVSIEQHIADQHPHKQMKLYGDVQDK